LHAQWGVCGFPLLRLLSCPSCTSHVHMYAMHMTRAASSAASTRFEPRSPNPPNLHENKPNPQTTKHPRNTVHPTRCMHTCEPGCVSIGFPSECCLGEGGGSRARVQCQQVQRLHHVPKVACGWQGQRPSRCMEQDVSLAPGHAREKLRPALRRAETALHHVHTRRGMLVECALLARRSPTW
jgi:hypothetical protein